MFLQAASPVVDDPMHYVNEELRKGAEYAFRSVAASIFQTSQPLLPAQLEDVDAASSTPVEPAGAATTVLETPSAAAEQEPAAAAAAAADDAPVVAPVAEPATPLCIDPKDVMEDKLADFFTKAMASAVLAGHKVCYQLDAVLDCTVTRTRVYAGIKRGKQHLSNLLLLVLLYAVIIHTAAAVYSIHLTKATLYCCHHCNQLCQSLRVSAIALFDMISESTISDSTCHELFPM
jgi:hypothetical protein